MKKIILILVLLMLVSLYFSNPTKTDFVSFTENKIVGEILDADILEDISESELANWLKRKTKNIQMAYGKTKRRNYLLYSTYRVESEDKYSYYIGVLNSFYEYNIKEKKDEIVEKVQDIIE